MASSHTTNQNYGRSELLDWVNNILGLNYTKVEETSNGAAYCQILDALYPGDVKLSRVNYNADDTTTMLANYKILQSVFDMHKIPKAIPVETLIKGKLMASLEMLQWMRNFFENNYGGGEYDGAARRAQCHCKNPGDKTSKRVNIKQNPPKTVIRQTGRPTTTATVVRNAQPPPTGMRTMKKKTAAPTSEALKEEIQRLKTEMDDLKSDNHTLLEERNFYFAKLQRVEGICQKKEGEPLAEDILNILYETDENHGFVAPDELDI